MDGPAATPPAPGADDIDGSPFAQTLVALIRAQDAYGRWDGKPRAAILAPYVVDKARRRRLPVIGEPDPATLVRVDLFYAAACALVERRSGLPTTHLIRLHAEGWGRAVLITGRLVALDRGLRDVHRFGFDSVAALALQGDGMVAEALATIARFPDAAADG